MKQSTFNRWCWTLLILMLIIIAVLLSGCATKFLCKCEAVAGEDCEAIAECRDATEIEQPGVVTQESKKRIPRAKKRTPTPGPDSQQENSSLLFEYGLDPEKPRTSYILYGK